jgi:hypothetical protein
MGGGKMIKLLFILLLFSSSNAFSEKNPVQNMLFITEYREYEISLANFNNNPTALIQDKLNDMIPPVYYFSLTNGIDIKINFYYDYSNIQENIHFKKSVLSSNEFKELLRNAYLAKKGFKGVTVTRRYSQAYFLELRLLTDLKNTIEKLSIEKASIYWENSFIEMSKDSFVMTRGTNEISFEAKKPIFVSWENSKPIRVKLQLFDGNVDRAFEIEVLLKPRKEIFKQLGFPTDGP